MNAQAVAGSLGLLREAGQTVPPRAGPPTCLFKGPGLNYDLVSMTKQHDGTPGRKPRAPELSSSGSEERR